MEAVFKGRLGQTVTISGNPEEIATTYAYLLAADIGSINAMEQAKQNPPKPTHGRYPLEESKGDGGYVEPPKMETFEGRDVDDIINGLLDWVLNQRRKDDGDNNGDK